MEFWIILFGALAALVDALSEQWLFKRRLLRIPLVVLLISGSAFFSIRKTNQENLVQSRRDSTVNSYGGRFDSNDVDHMYLQEGTNTANMGINTIQDQNDSLRRRVEQLQDDNFKLSRALTQSTLELQKNIIGEGYAIFNLVYNAKEKTYVGVIVSKSNYPLYDLFLMMTDVDALDKCKKVFITETSTTFIDQQCIFDNTTNWTQAMILPNSINYLSPYKWPENTPTKKFMIQMKFRNATYVQQCVIEKNEFGLPCKMNYRLMKQDRSGKAQTFKIVNEIPSIKVNWDNDFISPNNLKTVIMN